tara:strand:- start:5544 stop:6188 length:645 start_codon:yes stop_codon:yes gene_type:complete
MKYIYLSHLINNDSPLYGGSNDLKISTTKSILNGDSCNSLKIEMPNHAGTHIDFPYHFGNSGKKLQDYKASSWIFCNAYLLKLDVLKNQLIKVDDYLTLIPSETDLLLLKTNFSKNRGKKNYWNNNPGIDSGQADLLKNKFPKLRAVGFDFISLSSFQNRELGRIVHREFLIKNDILIIEDMDLQYLNDHPSEVIVSPLSIENADGAPVTVIAK